MATETRRRNWWTQKPQLERGQLVSVCVYGGEWVPRRVWNDHGGGIEVCSEDDYQLAVEAGVQPRSVGFPREDVRAAQQQRPADQENVE